VVKRPEHVADQPPTFSAELGMGWSLTSASPLCLHKHVIRVAFTFTLPYITPLVVSGWLNIVTPDGTS
jgi:hypothetical protein